MKYLSNVEKYISKHNSKFFLIIFLSIVIFVIKTNIESTLFIFDTYIIATVLYIVFVFYIDMSIKAQYLAALLSFAFGMLCLIMKIEFLLNFSFVILVVSTVFDIKKKLHIKK